MKDTERLGKIRLEIVYIRGKTKKTFVNFVKLPFNIFLHSTNFIILLIHNMLYITKPKYRNI